MAKAISGNHPEDPKVSTSSHRKQRVAQLFKFPRRAKHFSSPTTRLSAFLPVLTALCFHGLHHLHPHTEYQSSPSMSCSPCMPYQKTTARTILVLWSALGFPPKASAALQITKVSTALPRVLDIWKSRWSKFNLLLQRSEPSELLS